MVHGEKLVVPASRDSGPLSPGPADPANFTLADWGFLAEPGGTQG